MANADKGRRMTDASTVYGGSGDPARSLALLWRTRERSGRKGRTDLDVDRIVRAAIELADADGLAALSMRRVADRLGVAVMSLYTYVPGKAELIDVMFDTVCAEADSGVDEDGADEDGGWRARLERVARDNWAMYHRHPWMLHVAPNRPVLGPHALAMYERELNAIDGIGLSDVEMDSVVILVAGHVEGAARRSIETAQAERRTGMTDQQWWSAHAPLLAELADFRRFPTASRVGSAAGEAHGAAYDPDHAFEFGLQRVLDGIEALVRSRNPAYEGGSA
jgi:AcrR family transcriptional regulator